MSLENFHIVTGEDIARAAVERTVYGYAQEYLYVDQVPFSFENHNYLVDIYTDIHPYQVIEKSAQMGASVYAMAKAFFVCDKMGKNVIYFFPTDTDVTDFSKTRVGPMVHQSPHLKQVCKSDSLGLRQVNNGWLYMRGMKSSIAMKSIPADFLVFDELDEVTEDAEALADQRLNHSALKWRLKLSTPTFEGFGIDREFQKSDQRYWNLVCPKCEHRNILEKQFPDCVVRLSETKCVLVCEKCKAELNTQYGLWVPEKNTERIRGYHICGLYSHFLDLSELMYEYEEGRRREEFYRSKLGIPYTSADSRITRDMVYACFDPTLEPHTDRHTYMGVDQRGSELHITIRKVNKLTNRHELICIEKVAKFDQLDRYMRVYDVDLCVIDGLPNQHSAREFAARFPGRVFLCYYEDNQKGDYSWREPKAADPQEEWSVRVNRTEALDAMYEQVQRREIALPKTTPKEYVEQMIGLARVNETDEDGTIMRAIWKRLGEDHYAHASSYSLIAWSRYGEVSHRNTLVVKPPSMARIAYARRYEMGSRF